eukprot:scaffold6620_cov110-Isochrysis_galbana.AAC.4
MLRPPHKHTSPNSRRGHRTYDKERHPLSTTNRERESSDRGRRRATFMQLSACADAWESIGTAANGALPPAGVEGPSSHA